MPWNFASGTISSNLIQRFKSKQGVLVGTGIKLAPPFACLGMGQYEDLVFQSDQELTKLILIWKRFVDDVFKLFRGSKEQCQNLVSWLNTLMPGVIEFKFKYSREKSQNQE